MLCRLCCGPLTIVSLTDAPAIIEKILRHLKLRERPQLPPAAPAMVKLHYEIEIPAWEDGPWPVCRDGKNHRAACAVDDPPAAVWRKCTLEPRGGAAPRGPAGRSSSLWASPFCSPPPLPPGHGDILGAISARLRPKPVPYLSNRVSAFQGFAHGGFVDEFEVASHRQTERDAGHADANWLE